MRAYIIDQKVSASLRHIERKRGYQKFLPANLVSSDITVLHLKRGYTPHRELFQNGDELGPNLWKTFDTLAAVTDA